ncbi:CBO0543 family protein [Peribacillus sp. SCS-155]|uniref:CBO0543 family protein n=1 Tax=Peribacillus sedimenti TaxID=3115297 RepID=UPI0039065F79
MHVAITILTVLASFKWGNWKEWKKYHASMFFIATGGLLYEYMVKDYTLWKFHPDFLFNHDMTVIIYALITMPVSIFLFLQHFPKEWSRRVAYIFLWSGIYIAVEWLLLKFDRISYQNGWHFWYSYFFDLMMFSIIALHQYHPILAYILSIFIIFFLLGHFNVPFKFTI